MESLGAGFALTRVNPAGRGAEPGSEMASRDRSEIDAAPWRPVVNSFNARVEQTRLSGATTFSFRDIPGSRLFRHVYDASRLRQRPWLFYNRRAITGNHFRGYRPEFTINSHKIGHEASGERRAALDGVGTGRLVRVLLSLYIIGTLFADGSAGSLELFRLDVGRRVR